MGIRKGAAKDSILTKKISIEPLAKSMWRSKRDEENKEILNYHTFSLYRIN